MNILNTLTGIKWLPKNSTLENINLAGKIYFEKDYGKPTSVFAFIFKGDDIALLKHTNTDRGYDIPGGHIDPGEGPFHALHREVMEEIGSTIENITLIGCQRITKEITEPKYPDLLSCQLFYKADFKDIITTDLADNSQGLVFMNKNEFAEVLKKQENNHYLELYLSVI